MKVLIVHEPRYRHLYDDNYVISKRNKMRMLMFLCALAASGGPVGGKVGYLSWLNRPEPTAPDSNTNE